MARTIATENPMVISVIIPVYNGGQTFRRCLEALNQSSYECWECIVIDDGSTDDSMEIARKYGAKILQNSHPQAGPAQARNLGAQFARGELLFFVDADVLVEPGTIGHVVDIMTADESLGACFGSYDDSPDQGNFLSQYRNLQHHFVHQTSQAEANTFWTGCGAIRRQVFLKMGGFSTEYARPSIEDIQLGYRLKLAGYRIRLEKTLQVRHLKRWTAGKVLVTDIRDRAIPWSQLLVNKGSLPNDLNLQTSQRISVAVVFLGIAATAFSLFSPWAWFLVAACILLLLSLNWDFYRFLQRRRGIFFALLALPWHWLYFVYSALSFIGCLLWHQVLGFNNPASSMTTEAPLPLLAGLSPTADQVDLLG